VRAFSGSIKLPRVFWVLWTMAFLAGLFSANPLHTAASLLAIPLFIKLLWREQEMPVLFFSVAMQWLSITSKVFVANFRMLSFSSPEMHRFPQAINEAFFLSLAACVALAFGLSLATKNIRLRSGSVEDLLPFYDVRKCLILYVVFSVFANLLLLITWRWPGLMQAFIQLIHLKWGFFVLSGLLVFGKNSHKKVFLAIIFFEIILSLGAYFSSFKNYLIFFVLVLFSLRIKWNWRPVFFLTVLFLIGFNTLVVWTYVKPEYRAYLSGGEQAQIVTVGKTDALKKLWSLAITINREKYSDALMQLVDRVSYIDFFSASINYVPNALPFQNGKVLKDVVLHLALPRMFFPQKAAIDESDELNLYTGLSVANAEKGASISLGYIGQWYVDFGPVLMFIPIFLSGILLGGIYRSLLTKAPNLLWGYCLTAPLLLIFGIVEMSLRKIFGASVMYFIVMLLMIKLVIPRLDESLRNRIPQRNRVEDGSI
jgi:hypothetical protein